MNHEVHKLRHSFAEQLDKVSKDIESLNAQLKNCERTREQLMGALFALDNVTGILNKQAEQAPAAAPAPAATPAAAPAAPAQDQAAAPAPVAPDASVTAPAAAPAAEQAPANG